MLFLQMIELLGEDEGTWEVIMALVEGRVPGQALGDVRDKANNEEGDGEHVSLVGKIGAEENNPETI
jgi:hypothetical protein